MLVRAGLCPVVFMGAVVRGPVSQSAVLMFSGTARGGRDGGAGSTRVGSSAMVPGSGVRGDQGLPQGGLKIGGRRTVQGVQCCHGA